jgi:hypothetical protein
MLFLKNKEKKHKKSFFLIFYVMITKSKRNFRKKIKILYLGGIYMFVGFIAVVVILLVIVGLMSSGATNGSGGVDQTKATKALSEMSALAQSAGFFKTTTTNSDYTGMSTDALVTGGIVASADTATSTATMVGDAGLVGANHTVIKSKAVSGLYYTVDADSNVNKFDLNVIVDPALVGSGSGLAKALEQSFTTKFGTSAAVTNTTAGDGAVVAVF